MNYLESVEKKMGLCLLAALRCYSAEMSRIWEQKAAELSDKILRIKRIEGHGAV